MTGVDTRREVESRVGERDLGAPQPGGDHAGRAVGGARCDRPLVLGSKRPAREPPAREPGLGEGVIVIARDERDPLVGERRAEPLEEWPHLAEQRQPPASAQLEHVAEEHDPLGTVERGEQPIERLGVAREVVPARGAEVEIGKDRGLHRVDGGSSV